MTSSNRGARWTSGIPATATIVSARLRLKYYAKVTTGAAWVDRPVQAHEVLVDWVEDEATRDWRADGNDWLDEYGKFGDDFKSTPESAVLFTDSTPLDSWQ